MSTTGNNDLVLLDQQLEDFKKVYEAFPALVSVSLQCYFPDGLSINDAEQSSSDDDDTSNLATRIFSQRTERAVQFWKEKGVRVAIFPDQCAGFEGRQAIEQAAKNIGQIETKRWRV